MRADCLLLMPPGAQPPLPPPGRGVHQTWQPLKTTQKRATHCCCHPWLALEPKWLRRWWWWWGDEGRRGVELILMSSTQVGRIIHFPLLALVFGLVRWMDDTFGAWKRQVTNVSTWNKVCWACWGVLLRTEGCGHAVASLGYLYRE